MVFEKQNRGRFIWEALGAIISILSIIIFYDFSSDILIIGLLSGLCFAYTIYLNSMENVAKGIIKTLVYYIIVAVILTIIMLLSKEFVIEYLFYTLFFSFFLLPGIHLIMKILSIIIDLLPII